jgi:hypothetical protein
MNIWISFKNQKSKASLDFSLSQFPASAEIRNFHIGVALETKLRIHMSEGGILWKRKVISRRNYCDEKTVENYRRFRRARLRNHCRVLRNWCVS